MHDASRHSLDEAHVVGSLWNLLIVIWEGAATETAVASVASSAARLLESHPKGIGILSVAEEADLRAAAERQQYKDLVARQGTRLLGLASVMEGPGILVATARRVLTSINLVVKQPCPLRIFESVDEGVSWIAPLLGQSEGRPTMAAMRQATEGLRRELRAHRARARTTAG